MKATVLAWAVRRSGSEGGLGAAPVRIRRDVVRGVGLWAIDAARELIPSIEDPERTGLYVGMGGLRPGWDELMPRLATQDGGPPWRGGLRRFHPFWMLRNLSNNVHALLAAELGTTADGATYSGEDAGGVAVHAAIEALTLGVVDQALVVAYDSLHQPEIRVERAPPLAEAAAAVLLGRGPGVVVRAGVPRAAEASAFGAAGLLLELASRAANRQPGVFSQWAPPGLRCALHVSLEDL